MAKAFKPPKSLATCADLLYTIRTDRYAAQKIVDALAAKEAILREHLIKNLPKSDASGIAGKIARASVETKTIPQVEDWTKFTKYVIKNANKGAFALLQRRVNVSAVQELWDAKKVVPGCKAFKVPVVSVTKR